MAMITEKEAKKRWCPHARVMVDQDVEVSVNRSVRGGEPDPDCLCLASDCMAWRWESYRKLDDREGDRRGYCGAFGIPMESIV